MSVSPRFANRITRYAEVDPSTLAANPKNWRRHPPNQAAALAGVLSSVGYVQSVIVNERSGNIVDGHLRVELAVDRAEPFVPVAYVDLTDDEESLILATFDPLGALASTDAATLRGLLDTLSTDDASLRSMLDGLASRSGILPAEDPSSEWTGMPTFEHDDQTAYQTIRVHFRDAESVRAFAELTSSRITESTKSLWFPDDGLAPIGDAHYDDDDTA
jgi:hypothetical protein